MKGKRGNPLASRIKKVMQADEDVGRIAQATPILIGHAVEQFVQQICKGASEIATTRGDKTLGPAHLKAHVNKEAKLDFLRDIVKSAPELTDKLPSPTKRQRNTGQRGDESGSSSRGRGRGRGAVKQKRDPSSADTTPRKRAKSAKANSDVLPDDQGAAAVKVEADVPSVSGRVADQIPTGAAMKVDLACEESAFTATAAGKGGEKSTDAPGGAADESTPRPSGEQLKGGEEQVKLAPDSELRNFPVALIAPLQAPQAVGGIEDEDDYDEE